MGTDSLQDVCRLLEAIRGDMVGTEQRFFSRRPDIPDARRASAGNLLHYLVLRSGDRRELQRDLTAIGLSSLGRAESRVLAHVEALLGLLRRIGVPGHASLPVWPPAAAEDGKARLEGRTNDLFGPPPPGREVRIMVTVPTEAADDPRLIRDLVDAGMDCMRINTAHDDADAWGRMLAQLNLARLQTGRGCRVLMDLAGPRLRTGALQAGPPVVRWRPDRDVCGRVLRPARIWLTAAGLPVGAPDRAAAVLPVGDAWLASVRIGDVIRLTDARDKRRELTIVARGPGGVWAESEQAAYVLPGTRLRRRHVPSDARDTHVGELAPTSQMIVVRPGDTLVLTRSTAPGYPAVFGPDGSLVQPAVLGVTLPALFDDARAGQAIWFDDGRIGGTIRTVGVDRLDVEVVQARVGGSKLGAGKGINVPDTDLRLPALTLKDRTDLRFIAAHADIVGYSFVQTAAEVDALYAELAAVSATSLGLILKIETKKAFEQLPSLLLAGLRSPACGVMIARGDLAVECGFERLAEVQEEILWMAEASHTPVIWATQVLENLAKDGVPSRAEITDAAMGERAECVMLNKGPHITEAVRSLGDILLRMQHHQNKKSSRLRSLNVADRFLETLAREDESAKSAA